MLPKASRVRSALEFQRTIRSGVRSGRSTLVVSAHRSSKDDSSDPPPASARVGFVVSKAVGNAVTRNRVKRRLRHLSRPLLGGTPVGTSVVVRALPAAAAADADLDRDLAGAWRTCLNRLAQRSP